MLLSDLVGSVQFFFTLVELKASALQLHTRLQTKAPQRQVSSSHQTLWQVESKSCSSTNSTSNRPCCYDTKQTWNLRIPPCPTNWFRSSRQRGTYHRNEHPFETHFLVSHRNPGMAPTTTAPTCFRPLQARLWPARPWLPDAEDQSEDRTDLPSSPPFFSCASSSCNRSCN